MMDFIEQKRNALAKHLRANTQGEIRFDSTSRRLYSTDASIYQIEPLGVVIPRTTSDLITTVQIVAEMRIPITARGGGTSLSGQSIGPGIIVDCSKHLNQILDVDPVGKKARVEPGVILDQLNSALSGHGLLFGPDVATANRANLGGMIGNNSAGARSIIYGKTVDHVHRLKVVLSDGTPADFHPLSLKEWDRKATTKNLEGTIYRVVRQEARSQEDEIRRRFPRILRRVSGYNLDDFLPEREPKFDGFGLERLIVGSEGTLAVVTEAELDLSTRPQERGLVVLHFDSLAASMNALAACLEFQPSAVELMDQMLLELARQNLSLKSTMAAVQGQPAALLMVEFSGSDADFIANQADRLRNRLKEVPGLVGVVLALEPVLRDPLWNLRRAAVPLLLGVPGDRKPVTFVEDTAVSPDRLPEFVARFRDLLRRHGTDGAFYGHASVGCLHIRPLLNLKNPLDVKRMRQIASAVTDLVLEFDGALSGEHGDGLARSEWNHKMFGDSIYQAFRQIKHAFDPNNLLNPGKVVDGPGMTESLRFSPEYHPAEPVTLFDYSRQEGFVRSIEMCNGSGVCRKLNGGTMCPSYRATRDEKDSTRGRANALRLALTNEKFEIQNPKSETNPKDEIQNLMQVEGSKSEISSQSHGDFSESISSGLGFVSDFGFRISNLRARWVFDVLDLCLMCKACKSECPSNVDMAKLKSEFLNFYYQRRSRPWSHHLMARLYRLNQLAGPLAPLTNWLQGRGIFRWLLEKATGIDRRRSLPRLHARHFRRWHCGHSAAPAAGKYGRVLLLADCFTTYFEPEIGQSAVRVLERAGYTVELADMVCCCRPMISKGMLNQSRALIRDQIPRLARRVAEGIPILGLEPSCLLTLKDEWPELAPGRGSQSIAEAAELVENWFVKRVHGGRCDIRFAEKPGRCVLHGHCHQKALEGVSGTVSALHLVPGLEVESLDAGCCGMAGSFGYEKEHFDLSVAIAGLELLPALAARPDDVIVAPGTSCRHQIKDLAGRRALHPMEILAGQIEND
jgi:FAD/FMN-containing dehydrogenase/Fe-S oxidoreductase